MCCLDFTAHGKFLSEAELVTFGEEVGSKDAGIVKFETIKTIARYTNDVTEAELQKFYAEMFVVDAFVGNRDRHNGNWGFITDAIGTKMAPIYDCGSSLCPLLEEKDMSPMSAKRMAVNAMSAITDASDNKIVYKPYLSSGVNPLITKALKEVFFKIDIPSIVEIIDSVPYISEQQKTFYKEYVQSSYEHVLLESLIALQEKDIKKNTVTLDNDQLFSIYKTCLQQCGDIPLYETRNITLSGTSLKIKKLSNQYACIIKDNSVKCVFSTRSQSDKVRDTIDVFKFCMGIDLVEVSKQNSESDKRKMAFGQRSLRNNQKSEDSVKTHDDY